VAERRADWLSVEEARTAIMQSVAALPLEMVPLLSAAGRVLGEPITSPVDLPPWDSSAMDGYAVLGADAAGASDARPVSLRMLEDIPAGGFPTRPLRRGFATRVMTGAPVPEGTDSVIRVEHTGAADAESVSIVRDDDVGRNVRRRGEDLRSGDEVLAGGAVLLLLGWLWGFSLPIVKNRWTSSYVLWCGGLSWILFAVFYWLADVRRWRRWAALFIIIGSNSILAYLISTRFMAPFRSIASTLFQGTSLWLPELLHALLMVLVTYGMIWLLPWWLRKQRLYLKL